MKNLTSNRVEVISIAALAAVSAAITACGKATTADSSANESSSELAVAGAVGGSGAGTNVGLNSLEPALHPSLFARVQSFLTPISSAVARASCPYYIAGSTSCSSNAVTFTYDDCSFGNSVATWTGSQTLQFGGGATCDTTTLPLTGSGTLTRNLAPGTVRFSPSGLAVALDTQNASGWYQQVSGGFLITGVAGGHTVTIDGLHMVSAHWDHTLSTITPLQVTIDGSGNRTFVSGTAQIQHNLAKYVGSVVFNEVYVPAGSCFPSSGSVTTTFTGSRSGSETLQFNGGSSATLTSNGQSTSVTLSHCF